MILDGFPCLGMEFFFQDDLERRHFTRMQGNGVSTVRLVLLCQRQRSYVASVLYCAIVYAHGQ